MGVEPNRSWRGSAAAAVIVVGVSRLGAVDMRAAVTHRQRPGQPTANDDGAPQHVGGCMGDTCFALEFKGFR